MKNWGFSPRAIRKTAAGAYCCEAQTFVHHLFWFMWLVLSSCQTCREQPCHSLLLAVLQHTPNNRGWSGGPQAILHLEGKTVVQDPVPSPLGTLVHPWDKERLVPQRKRSLRIPLSLFTSVFVTAKSVFMLSADTWRHIRKGLRSTVPLNLFFG